MFQNDRRLCNHYLVDSFFPELPVFSLRESPSRERGQLLGALSAPLVARSLEGYRSLLPTLTRRSWTELVDLARPMIESSRRFDQAIVEDLEGLAVGAGVAFDDIAVLATRSELLQLSEVPIGECTTIVQTTRIGQTWDWFVRQIDACLVWQTPRFVAFGEAGMPPKIGVNTSGVAITLNFLGTHLTNDPTGLPVHILLHHLLERATSTADAIDRLLHAQSAACAAIGLLDATGEGAVLELAPDGRTTQVSAEHVLIQTNHCLSDTLRGTDTPGPLLVNSVARLTRAHHVVAAGASLESILADNDGTAHPIALSGDLRVPDLWQLGTVVAVILDAGQRSMLIAPGNPTKVGFTQSVSLHGTDHDADAEGAQHLSVLQGRGTTR